MRQAKKQEKKILDPNSVHTRPGQENIEKNSKKIKKPLPSIIFTQNGMRQAEKEKNKNLFPNSVHTRPGQENSEKNSQKIQKIIKPLPDNRQYFLPKGDEDGRKSENKILVSKSVHTRPGKKIQKKIVKKFKKL